MLNTALRVVIFLLLVGAISSAMLATIKGYHSAQTPKRQAESNQTGATSAPPAATQPANHDEADSRSTGKIGVIYYGWLLDDHDQPNAAAQRLAAGKPDLIVVAPYTDEPRRNNLPISVRALFHKAHTQVAIYIATNYGQRPLKDVQSAIADATTNGDWVFLDEVVPSLDPQTWEYYTAIAGYAHSAGLTVIANPGLATIDERIMDIADIVMLEHQWVQLGSGCGWCVKYPSDRFMGVSSNEPGAAKELRHAIDIQQAEADTRRAWALGVGWHYSCDRYTEVPPWYETYMHAVRGIH